MLLAVSYQDCLLSGSQELHKCAKKCSNPSMGEVDNLAAVLAVLEVTTNTHTRTISIYTHTCNKHTHTHTISIYTHTLLTRC